MTDDLKPCPFCNAEMQFDESGYEHPYSDTCPLDSLYIEDGHVTAWNSRATPTVQGAAKVLLAIDGETAARAIEAAMDAAHITPEQAMLAVREGVRAIAGESHD